MYLLAMLIEVAITITTIVLFWDSHIFLSIGWLVLLLTKFLIMGHLHKE